MRCLGTYALPRIPTQQGSTPAELNLITNIADDMYTKEKHTLNYNGVSSKIQELSSKTPGMA